MARLYSVVLLVDNFRYYGVHEEPDLLGLRLSLAYMSRYVLRSIRTLSTLNRSHVVYVIDSTLELAVRTAHAQ